MSAGPPGAYGTITRPGRAGQARAAARGGGADVAAAAAASCRNCRRGNLIAALPVRAMQGQPPLAVQDRQRISPPSETSYNMVRAILILDWIWHGAEASAAFHRRGRGRTHHPRGRAARYAAAAIEPADQGDRERARCRAPAPKGARRRADRS